MSRHDFDEFVAAGTDELLRTAYLIVWGLPEAEDLVQESLFKVAKRWPRVRRMDRPRAYARRMLVNLALGGRDKRMRRRAELEATAVEPAAAAPAEPHDELRAALEALLQRQRAVLVLRYFLDLPRVRGRGCARLLLARNGEEHRVACDRAAREDPREKEHCAMSQVEIDLRAGLHERAAGVHASPRLLAADYRPRTRRIGPPVAVAGALATAAGAVAAALTLTGGAGTAFAGWTPEPTTPTQAQLAAAEDNCSANVPWPDLPLQITDARGPFTFEVYSDGTSNDFCTTRPSFENASGFRTSAPLAVPAGQLFL